MEPHVALQLMKMESLNEELVLGLCPEPPRIGSSITLTLYLRIIAPIMKWNMEYDALIIGLVIALNIGILHLHAYGDSHLVIW